MKFIKKLLKTYLLSGIIFLGPIFLTIWIFVYLILLLDNLVEPFMVALFPDMGKWNILPFEIHGYGIVITLIVTIIAGIIGRHFSGRYFIRLSESILKRLPVIPKVYSLIKQVVGTIFSENTSQYSGVALVEYPRKGLFTLALITGKPDKILISALEVNDSYVNIFVPTTPNPTSGFYLMVKESEIKRVNISVEDAFKVIISCGIIKDIKEKELTGSYR